MSLDEEQVSRLKNTLCIGSVLIMLFGLVLENGASGVESIHIVGALFLLGGIIWDRWLYTEMFELSPARRVVTFGVFLWVAVIAYLLLFLLSVDVMLETIFHRGFFRANVFGTGPFS